MYGWYGFDDFDVFAFNFTVHVPLLIESGFKITPEARKLLEDHKNALHESEQLYIDNTLYMTRPLKTCCRDALRKFYKGNQIHKFVELPTVPGKVKDFSLFKK